MPVCVSCGVYLRNHRNHLEPSYRKLLKRHLNGGNVVFFSISNICDNMRLDASGRRMWRQSTSTNTLHCLCKTKMQMHSHSCSHTIISIIKTLIIQSDSRLSQYLDREDFLCKSLSSVCSLALIKYTSNTHLHLLSYRHQSSFSSGT